MRIAPLVGAVGALAAVLWMSAIGNRGSIFVRDNAFDHAACVSTSVLPGHRAVDPNSCRPMQRASTGSARYRIWSDAVG